MNFCQFLMRLGDIQSTSVNIPCSRETFCQLLSSVRVARRPSVDFPYGWDNLRELPSTFLQPGDFLSTFINFSCSQITFYQLSVWPGDLLTTSVNSPGGRETFHQPPSTFRTVGRPSFNFPFSKETFRQLSSTFSAGGRTSIKILCGQETYHQLPSNFCAAW